MMKFGEKCGETLDDEVISDILNVTDEPIRQAKVTDLIKSKTLMIVSSKLSFIWVVTSLSYYKLAIGEKSGSLMENNIWNGIVEIVSLFIGAFFIRQTWCKRTRFLAFLFFLTACSLAMDSIFSTLNQ